MNTSPGSPPSPRQLEAADKAVLTHGAIAAALSLILYFLVIRRLWPSGNLYALTFLLQFAWLPTLAGAMLAGMRSGRRWLVATAMYGLVLPALSAYGLGMGGEVPPHEAHGLPNRTDLFCTLLMTSVAAFLMLPLIQALDFRKPQWNYPSIFRAAWRNAVHLGMAGSLTLAVCLLLWAAGAMFRMIGIPIVQDIVTALPFQIALWPMILAASLVGVRRRPQLAEMLQRSWLTLNAWLLPLVTLVGVAFTIALAARLTLDLQAVTLSAGGLIAFSLLWIKLINAAWQDSEESAPFGPRLRRLLRWGMLCLLPLAAVAAYGIAVRIEQYGWTISRVWAVYASVLTGLYGLGYAWAALRPKRYYATLAATNLMAAGAMLALLAAIALSWASPQRIAAQSQMARLIDGRVQPDTFRYIDMKDSHGQWGRAVLQRLADGAANSQDPRIALAAADALIRHRYYPWDDRAKFPLTPELPAFTVYPDGHDVPQAWWTHLVETNPHLAKDCLPRSAPGSAPAPFCQLIFADISGDGQDDIILHAPPSQDGQWTHFGYFAYSAEPSGTWRLLGRLQHESGAYDSAKADVEAAIRQGLISAVPPVSRDLLIGDSRLRLQ
jgi:hypothetical protein